jgi:hypothetical protein
MRRTPTRTRRDQPLSEEGEHEQDHEGDDGGEPPLWQSLQRILLDVGRGDTAGIMEIIALMVDLRIILGAHGSG